MIYSVDFDGTLCDDRWPDIGSPNRRLIEHLKNLRTVGNELILNTMREDNLLDAAVEWCAGYGLYFDAVNDNLPRMKAKYNNNPRKIFADVYVDDRNARDGILADLPYTT
jgi:hypothetical protein